MLLCINNFPICVPQAFEFFLSAAFSLLVQFTPNDEIQSMTMLKLLIKDNYVNFILFFTIQLHGDFLPEMMHNFSTSLLPYGNPIKEFFFELLK